MEESLASMVPENLRNCPLATSVTVKVRIGLTTSAISVGSSPQAERRPTMAKPRIVQVAVCRIVSLSPASNPSS